MSEEARAQVASNGLASLGGVKPVSVLVADLTRMGCQLLSKALVGPPHRFQVVASTTSRAEILACLSRREVDIVVLGEDLDGGPYTGFEALREVHARYPHSRVIMLLRAPTADLVVDAFRLGAKGVFSREGSIELFCKCIYSVYKGQIWANSHELQFLLEALAKAAPFRLTELNGSESSNGSRLLARREEEVANLVAEGMTNRQIAEKLRLSEHTVSNYLFRIYQKLGICSRVELVLYVLRRQQLTG